MEEMWKMYDFTLGVLLGSVSLFLVWQVDKSEYRRRKS